MSNTAFPGATGANFSSVKTTVREALKTSGQIAKQLGMQTLVQEIVERRLPKFEAERFNLVVLGEFNHGKSTFVNALLGEELLPVGITPTTATINHIVWSEKATAQVFFRSGEVREIASSDLRSYVTLEGTDTESIDYVELGHPNAFLRDNITLVDTPGVNDINQARAEITYQYVPRADAVIFLLDATQVLKQSERAFISTRLLQRNCDKLIFILGKVDLLDADEKQEALAFARENIGKMLPDAALFPLSAKQHLADPTSDSGMEALQSYLQHYLRDNRAAILVDRTIAQTLRTTEYLAASVGIRQNSLELPLEELSARVTEIRGRLDDSLATVRQAMERIDDDIVGAQATFRNDLREFVERFCNALPAQIDQVDPSDIKRYLEPFIRDTYKIWLEREGEKIGVGLEELTLEVIRITNEKAQDLLDQIATELGETQVDFRVDTFKYDAGVFALGAIGTTVFFFGNALVGGLLTLAAPVLAKVAKGQLEKQIRQQAKTNAPKAIREAAAEIEPQVSEQIAAYGERLRDFVTTAGANLHRGITEVLNAAMQQRQTTESNQSGERADLEQLGTQIEGLRKELLELREQLWLDTANAAS